MNINNELIRKLPKTDIHLHLDGSIRLDTMIELAKKDGIELPAYTTEGLEETLFKESYNNLEEYLKTFGYSCAVLQKPENLERVAFEIAEDNWNEGVRYIEVRFAPQLVMNRHQDFTRVLTEVNNGFKRAQAKFNNLPQVKSGKEPPFHYGIIICAMRFFGPWSEYYQSFYDCFSHSDVKRIIQFGSEAVADAAIKTRRETDIPIVSFDIAGAENGNPAKWHTRSFKKIREANIHTTVHAGEAYDAESIAQALFNLHTERIGHGFHLFLPDKIKNPEITDKKSYTDHLMNYIRDHEITLEVCITSNIQTTPFLKTFSEHPLGEMLKNEVPVAICTDNRTVSKTSVSKELMIVAENFALNSGQLKDLIMQGFNCAFYYGTHPEKKAYLDQCEKYYDQIAANVV